MALMIEALLPWEKVPEIFEGYFRDEKSVKMCSNTNLYTL